MAYGIGVNSTNNMEPSFHGIIDGGSLVPAFKCPYETQQLAAWQKRKCGAGKGKGKRDKMRLKIEKTQ